MRAQTYTTAGICRIAPKDNAGDTQRHALADSRHQIHLQRGETEIS